MIGVTFRCPHCDRLVELPLDPWPLELACPACGARWPVPADAMADGKLRQCLVCPSRDLFVRKDFSQRLGVTIVVAGFAISSVFWYYRMPLWTYGVLFATALLDVVLYLVVGNVLECYRCQAQYRGIPGLEDYAPFDLETHEKHRQQQARLAAAGQMPGPHTADRLPAASHDRSASTP
jgi:hypothetical protein